MTALKMWCVSLYRLTYHNNYIYVDRSNHRIRRVHATTGTTITFGGLGSTNPWGYRDGDYDRSLFTTPGVSSPTRD